MLRVRVIELSDGEKCVAGPFVLEMNGIIGSIDRDLRILHGSLRPAGSVLLFDKESCTITTSAYFGDDDYGFIRVRIKPGTKIWFNEKDEINIVGSM